ncbi:MAG: hypothetical protein JO019_03580 [Candidatus Kaiserbacteria bacterium]|nr:hypothetical protein [Candidatus Kaiserbacteria bacterium]
MNKEKALEKLLKCRANIISDAIAVEIALDWTIRLYFFPKTNHRASAFHALILDSQSFGFDKKISLFENIGYFKRLKHYAKIKQALRSIQRFRNAVAHWSYYEIKKNKEEIVLHRVDYTKEIVLNARTVAEFLTDVNFVVKAFGFPNSQDNWEF